MPVSVPPALDVGVRLSEQVGGFGPDEARVKLLLSLFRVAAVGDVNALMTALKRVACSVPWVPDALGQPDLVAFLSRTLVRIDAKEVVSASRSAAQSRLRGDFALAGTMVGSEANIMPGPENLRAALWVCHELWTRSNQHCGTAVNDLASALRNLLKIRGQTEIDRHPVARHLTTLAEAQTLPAFIEAAEVLSTCGQKGLEQAWRLHFNLELRRIAQGLPAPSALPSRSPPPLPMPPTKGKRKEQEFDEDAVLDAIVDQVRIISLAPQDADPEKEPEEPASEVIASGWICPLPSFPLHPDARQMATYQSQQTVWGMNHLLLTNHPDVLPAAELRQVIRILLEQMLIPEMQEGLAFGCVALLLQGITGRTPKTLPAIRAVDALSPTPLAGSYEICLGESAFGLGAFWSQEKNDGKSRDASVHATGFFNPSAEQAPWLESIALAFKLPLPTGITDSLRPHIERVTQLARTDQKTVEGWLRVAARHVSEQLGIRVTAGQIRRSFAAHLFEHCRDTALTQLICADTLGLSTAPLHYYAPRVSTIAKAYWALLQDLLGTSDPLPAKFDKPDRVGSAMLVKADNARQMSIAPASILQSGVSRMLADGRWQEIHEAMVTHLACMLLTVAGHRPVDALFRLRVSDLYLDPIHGCGLFRDKVHDPAHDPRLAALPPCLVRQIGAYLSHLQGLAELDKRFEKRVAQILAGKAPLLFGVTSDGDAYRPTMKTWRASLPVVWQVVPLHWGRTWIRTLSIEEGLRPELASIQLGHLEAVGYPFSNGSPTRPEAFLSATCPILEKLADRQGWLVRQGIPSNAARVTPTLPPLRLWSTQVATHEQAIRDQAKAWRLQQKARIRDYRKQAEQDVLTHPALLAAGIDTIFASAKGPWQRHSLTKQAAEAVRDSLLETAGEDEALGLARAEALSRIMRKVNKRVGLAGEEPAPLVLLRRPVDNAFVPGMMDAVRQVRALRQAVLKRSAQPPGDWRDFALACARTAQALAIFGFCEEPAQILGVLAHRHQFIASAALDDTILVPWGTASHQVIAPRGLAALAVLRLAKKYPVQPMPSRDAINASLRSLLPDWAVPQPKADKPVERPPTKDETSATTNVVIPDLLTLLCETVAVANRFELSPAARLALKTKGGSVNAHLNEQIALLDGDPSGTLNREWERSDASFADSASKLPGASKANARWQYGQLCAALPHAGVDLRLVRTGVTIPSADLFNDATRPKVIAEVKAMLAQDTPQLALQPIVRLLATWVLQMLEEGTQATNDPADVTIHTYLTRIGGSLVEVIGNSSLQHMEDAELEDIYLGVIRSKADSRDKAAAAILAFHDCCSREFGMPDVELGEVRAYLAQEARSVDARLILPPERHAAIDALIRSAESIGGVDREGRDAMRTNRQAGAAMPFYAYGGARRSEILGAKYSDLSLQNGAPWARIRANRSRRLKTRAARRVIHLAAGSSREHTGHFVEWMAADRMRIPNWRLENAFVFSPLDSPRSAAGRDKVATVCRKALAAATRRPSERLHRLRHLVAFEKLTPPFLSFQDAARLQAILPKQEFAESVALPRDLMAQVITLGHAHWSTTLTCYHHLPWLLRSQSDAIISAAYLDRRGVAAVMGLTLPAVDRITQQSKDKPDVQAWFDAARNPRQIPAAVAMDGRESDSGRSRWSAKELGALLENVGRAGNLETPLLMMGAGAADAERIRKRFMPFEQRMGRRLIGERPEDNGLRRPRRIARRLEDAKKIEILWSWFDDDTDGMRKELGELAVVFYDWMEASDREWLKGTTDAVERFVHILKSIGVSETHIERRSHPLDLMSIRIRRSDMQQTAAMKKSEVAEKRESVAFTGFALKRILGVIWAAGRDS